MGKWLRKIWVGLLAGVALLTSCNINKPEPCLYGPPPFDPTEDSIMERNNGRAALKERLQAVRDILDERLNAEVYGSPEVMKEYATETARLKAEADSLQKALEDLDQ